MKIFSGFISLLLLGISVASTYGCHVQYGEALSRDRGVPSGAFFLGLFSLALFLASCVFALGACGGEIEIGSDE